jgi:hypothetical protein
MRRFSGRRGTRSPLSSSSSSTNRSSANRSSSSSWCSVAVTVIITVATMIILRTVQTQDAAVWLQDSMLTLQQASTDFLDTTVATNSVSSTVAPKYQLAFEQSLGFFDDIPNDLWTGYYQTRARKAEHYREPKRPNSRMGWTHHWNFFNWDP